MNVGAATATGQNDFNDAILNETAHRPWPMPAKPWVMTQTWHDLLFAHWPVDREALASRIPAPFDLDLFEGEAWLGVVPFHMTNVAPRAVPALPWISDFPELNVRMYVRSGDKPGVYFFSLDAGNPLAVRAARALFNLPYYSAAMKVKTPAGGVSYESRRKRSRQSAELTASYEPAGPVYQAQPGSLDYFLTERYCLYALDRKGRPYRLEIHHPPWPLQAARAVLTRNTMAAAAGICLPDVPALLHFAKRQDMVAWAPDHLQH